MDEVLASLQRGQIQLRKVPPPSAKPTGTPAETARDSIMLSIRQGVKLKKVERSEASPGSRDTELERSIKAAMQRMKRVSSDSDDEEDESDDHGDTQSEEWAS